MSKSKSRLSRLGVLAPAALSACIDASVLAAPAAGAVFSTVLKELSKAFMLKKWFYGIMSWQEAEQLLLQKGKQGSYLVRESRAYPGQLVLSVRVRARVSHVLIHKEQNRYNVGSGEVFEDLSELIEHCRAYPLIETSGEVLRLRQPVSGARARSRHLSEKPSSKPVAVETSAPAAQQPQVIMEPHPKDMVEHNAQTSPTAPKQQRHVTPHRNITRDVTDDAQTSPTAPKQQRLGTPHRNITHDVSAHAHTSATAPQQQNFNPFKDITNECSNAVNISAKMTQRQKRRLITKLQGIIDVVQFHIAEVMSLLKEGENPDEVGVTKESPEYNTEFYLITIADILNTHLTTIEGLRSENMYKNRYTDVLPFDQTRVPLPRECCFMEGVGTDYINANYIRPDWMLQLVLEKFRNLLGPTTMLHSADWEEEALSDKRASSNPKSNDSVFVPSETTSANDYLKSKHVQAAVGLVSNKFYIATQGCIPTTKYAFWAMLADNDVRVIAMITECVEDGAKKCDVYWPPQGVTEQLNDLSVTNMCEYVHPNYTTRELNVVTGDRKRRIVYQYQFTTWKDHETTNDAKGLLRYIRDLNERMKTVAKEKTAPKHNILCVHCSAGIGRTGTFIAIDMMLDVLKIEQHYDVQLNINVPGLVKLLRRQRPGMVQNVNQYVSIYEAMGQYYEDLENDSVEPPFVSF